MKTSPFCKGMSTIFRDLIPFREQGYACPCGSKNLFILSFDISFKYPLAGPRYFRDRISQDSQRRNLPHRWQSSAKVFPSESNVNLRTTAKFLAAFSGNGSSGNPLTESPSESLSGPINLCGSTIATAIRLPKPEPRTSLRIRTLFCGINSPREVS